MLLLRAVLIVLMTITVAAVAADPPERLHIVLNAQSDAAPFWSAYLMELQRSSPGEWELRWSRIAPTSSLCSRIDVKSDFRRLSGEAMKAGFEKAFALGIRVARADALGYKSVGPPGLLSAAGAVYFVAREWSAGCSGQTKLC